MQLMRILAAPLAVFVVFIALTILGLATGGAGWVALSLLCAWPLVWAVTAWTVKGIQITVAPKAAAQPRQRREVLG